MAAGTRVRRMVTPEMLDSSGVDHPANAPQVGAEGWLVLKQTTTGSGAVVTATTTKEATVPDATDAPPAPGTETTDAPPPAEGEADKGGRSREELLDALDKAEKDNAKLKATIDELKAKAEGKADKSDEDGEQDAVEKALSNPDLDPVVKAALTAQRDALAAAEKQAKADRETVEKMAAAETDRTYFAKASEPGYAGLTTTPEQLAPILKAVGESIPPEMVAEVDRLLRSASATASEAAKALTVAKGSGSAGTPGQAGVMAEVTKAAGALMTADPTLSAAAAEARVWEQRPDLVDRYRTEG